MPDGEHQSSGDPFSFTAIVLVKKEATDVSDFSARPSSCSSHLVYDLQGCKVTKTSKGLYIVNGKKDLR